MMAASKPTFHMQIGCHGQIRTDDLLYVKEARSPTALHDKILVVPLGFAPRLRVSKTPVTASTPWDIQKSALATQKTSST